MKKNTLYFIGLLLLTSCNFSINSQKSFSASEIKEGDYKNFGAKVSSEKIYNKNVISEKYEAIQEGDTVSIAFSSTINNVCKAKGCWIKVALDNDKETMVKFKDYGFFVPKDVENDTVIVQGRAFVSEMSVDEQRHFASDAGKSEEEIAAITEPKRTYSFIADGVLIKE